MFVTGEGMIYGYGIRHSPFVDFFHIGDVHLYSTIDCVIGYETSHVRKNVFLEVASTQIYLNR